MLERFGFTGDRLTARLGDLSGGERRRFQLLKLLLTEPNVLLLDEPTNDLDIETLNVLEDFLDGWPGTLVVVSHDRYFLERVTDSVWALLGDGQVSMLPARRGRVPRAPRPPRGRRRRERGRAGSATERGRASRRTRQPNAESPGVSEGAPGSPRTAPPARRWPASRSSSSASPHARRSCTPRWRPTSATTTCSRASARQLDEVAAEKEDAGAGVARGDRGVARSAESPLTVSSRIGRCNGPIAQDRQPGQLKGAERRSSRRAGRALSGRSASRSALGLEQGLERAVDGGLALGGEPHQHATSVLRVGQPLDQAARRRAGRRGWSWCRWSPGSRAAGGRGRARRARRRGAARPARRTPTTRCRGR